jgi:hypothetical protein
MRTFFYERRVSPQDGRRCRVCGHLSLTPVRRTFNALLLVVIGMLFAYIVLDIAHDGTLDGSILGVIREERSRLGHSVEASQPR